MNDISYLIPIPTASAKSTSPARPTVGVMQLANALATCVLSARLLSSHRQWAARQLLRLLSVSAHHKSAPPGGLLSPAAGASSSRTRLENQVDLSGDMPACKVAKLEAHENRVTGCVHNAKKNLLATRSVP